MSNAIILRTSIVEICAHRDAAIQKMQEAARTLVEGYRLAEEAGALAKLAHGASTFTLKDHSAHEAYHNLFRFFDPTASLNAFRKQVDARVWMQVSTLCGMNDLMDRTAKEHFDRGLSGDVPEFTEEAARQVFADLLGDAKLIFQRGLARVFAELDKRFKSHDTFRIGSRIILTNVFTEWGSFNYHSRMRETIADIERVFAVLDGQPPNPGALCKAIEADRRGLRPQQSTTETEYFRIRCYQNGNAHLWFKRDDLVEKANQTLAEYYGAVLPDAVPREDSPEKLRSKSGLPAQNLSFYPTPDAVVHRCLDNVHIPKNCRALEPSAGTGCMVRHLLDHGANVDAVEIDPDRVRALERIGHPRLSVHAGNFLTMLARPEYDIVLMNPPFYGTHWMEHVVHAFDFLKPGGKLVAVLPVTAEVGESAKHETFRKWVASHSSGWRLPFTSLPAESFAASGTRINTVVLTLDR